MEAGALGDPQQFEDAETVGASEKSDVQIAAMDGTEDSLPPSTNALERETPAVPEGSLPSSTNALERESSAVPEGSLPPSTNALERESPAVPEGSSQLHFRATHVPQNVNEEIEMSNITSSVSVLRSDSWGSMEVSATLPQGARVVYSSEETEVSMNSIQCEMQSNNNSNFSSVIADSLDRIHNGSKTFPEVISSGICRGIFVLDNSMAILRRELEKYHEIKVGVPTNTESDLVHNTSSASSKVQAYKAFFDGKASAENKKSLGIEDSSVKSIPDEEVNIENISSNNKDSAALFQHSNQEEVTVSEDVSHSGRSSACEVIEQTESIDSKQLSAEKSRDLKNENDGKELSEGKCEDGLEPFTVPTALKSEEKQTNLKNASLVLPTITITEVSDVEDNSEDGNEDSDEDLISTETQHKVSAEIEKEAKFSEDVKEGESFKDLQSVSNEDDRFWAEILEAVKGEAKELISVGNTETGGANDKEPTSDVPSDSNQLVSAEETVGDNQKPTAASDPCSSAAISDDSEVSDESEQIEERKAFFYISSSEIQPKRLQRASGYTNLAFEDSEDSSDRQSQRSVDTTFSTSENERSGPSECLGSASLHGSIILLSSFAVYIGYCLYSLAQEKRVPDFFETVGLSTSAIAGVVGLFSSLYLGVQWCGRSFQSGDCGGSTNASPEYSERMPLLPTDCGYHATQPGFVDLERGRGYEERGNAYSALGMYQNQPSESGLSDSIQKVRTETTGLLEALADAMSRSTPSSGDSAEVDFTREEVAMTSPAGSDPSLYFSTELPPDSKEGSEEQDVSKKKD